MKLKLMTLMIAMMVSSVIHVTAQQHDDESRIKIMPTSKPGILKLLYAITTEEPVTVNFITDEGIVSSDKITGSFPKGLLKRYDVRQINHKDFRIEISSSRLTATFRVIPSKDRKTFTSHLERAVHNYDAAIASRK